MASKKRKKKRAAMRSPISTPTMEAAAKLSKDFADGITYTTDSLTTVNPTIFTGISGAISGTSTTWFGRSKEEEAEYQALKKEHDLAVIAARKTAFAKLPIRDREAIIYTHELPTTAKAVKEQVVNKATRLAELEGKSNPYALSYSGFDGFFHSGGLPDTGLTLKDMKEVHTDTCFEEEVLHVAVTRTDDTCS